MKKIIKTLAFLVLLAIAYFVGTLIFGTITDYKSFAIDNPARIVFDIYNIESLNQGGQTIAVDSKWVKRIRYYPYPDKVRLVLDTQRQFLTKYFSFPTGSGLLIYVGQMPEPLDKAG